MNTSSGTQKNLVARALGGHSALALVISGFLYVLCLSGVIAVFAHEIELWEQPGVPVVQSVTPDMLEQSAQEVLAAEPEPTTHFTITLPTAETPRLRIRTDSTAVYVDAEGRLATPRAVPWTSFLLDLHYYLHLPGTLGLTVVALLGVMLLGLTVTGILAHPRIFRDAFFLRFRRSERLFRTDLHNRLGVWTSPFVIAIALTGAMIGLASVVAFTVGQTSFNGDTHAIFDPIFGKDPAPDDEARPLPDMASALNFMKEQFPDVTPTHVLMHHPGTAGQDLKVLAQHPDRLIFGEYYAFDQDGQFIGRVGLSDGHAGQQIAASAYTIHFGDYGGLPVKVGYGLLGLGLLVMISSGMRVYFLRRRTQGRPLPRAETVWAGAVWGTPAALAMTLLANLLFPTTEEALVPLFWVTLTANILATSRLTAAVAARALRLLTAVALVVSVILWYGLHADTDYSATAFGVSLVILGAGLGLGLEAFLTLFNRRKRQTAVPGAQETQPQKL